MPIPLGHAVTWRNVTVTAASGAAFNSCFVTRLIPPEGRTVTSPCSWLAAPGGLRADDFGPH